jgi:hypothetical protein
MLERQRGLPVNLSLACKIADENCAAGLEISRLG